MLLCLNHRHNLVPMEIEHLSISEPVLFFSPHHKCYLNCRQRNDEEYGLNLIRDLLVGAYSVVSILHGMTALLRHYIAHILMYLSDRSLVCIAAVVPAGISFCWSPCEYQHKHPSTIHTRKYSSIVTWVDLHNIQYGSNPCSSNIITHLQPNWLNSEQKMIYAFDLKTEF